MSARKVSVLAANLPPGSAVWRALGLDSAWREEAHLLAAAVDVLQEANWQRAGARGRRPDPVQRPSDQRRSELRAARNASKARDFLARQSARLKGGEQ